MEDNTSEQIVNDAAVLQMDNGAYERDRPTSGLFVKNGQHETIVEMGDLKLPQPICANLNGVCATNSEGMKGVRAPPESPLDKLKTIFLVTIIVLLILWLIIYILVDRNNMW